MQSHVKIFVLIIALTIIADQQLWAQHIRPDDGFLYDNTLVPKIEIFLPQDSLNIMLDEDNLRDNHEYISTCVITKGNSTDTLYNTGFRLRGNTSRLADKKSFKISFNTYQKGRKYKGVEKLNLNGEHNDPSIVRAKLVWDIFAEMEVPSARVNHVRLHINGEYRGLYLNVEHIDEEFIAKRFTHSDGNLFKCLWPASLEYINSNPDSYKHSNNGRRAYDLKTNTEEDDYSGFVDLLWKLNTSINANFQCKIEEVLDVNSVLKGMAVDMLTANWDGVINQNNFYLYEDLVTGKFYWIPYDLDNSFGIDWFGIDWASVDVYSFADRLGGNRPLYEQMLALPEYRAKYTYYVDQLLEAYFNNETLEPILDDIHDKILPFRISDFYAAQDYNWTVSDFNTSYESSVGDHVKYGLKPFINKRHDRARAQLDAYDILPIMNQFKIEHKSDQVSFEAEVIDDQSVAQVRLHYSIDNGVWQEAEMTLSPDGFYTYDVEFAQAGIMNYYIYAIDNMGQGRNFPICGDTEINIGYGPTPDLVINEFLASNTATIVDEEQKYEDWIEIYNADSNPVLLSDYYMSDDSTIPNKWQLPNKVLAPDNYLLIWADNDVEQGANHANFKLSKNGENVGIYDRVDNNFAPVDFVIFSEQIDDVSYGRSPNGIGDFTMLNFTSPNANNDIDVSTLNLGKVTHKIYPNPSSDLLFLDVEGLNCSYFISDVKGSIVSSGDYGGKINISDLDCGLYYITISMGSHLWSDKFLIVR